mmetsp:Transcript_13324/g.37669  ORF Transcript_13324/g.37669 Transcript_13324/m.37669 type:complete len:121 (-) Transcript_13324:391-753(-)
MGDESGQIQIRFRHISGDVGPFPFPGTATILNLKERVCQEWQTAGKAPEGETAKTPASVKLIFNGKFLDDTGVLNDLKAMMGDQQIVTFHLVVRPEGSTKQNGKSAERETSPKACGCVVQ